MNNEHLVMGLGAIGLGAWGLWKAGFLAEHLTLARAIGERGRVAFVRVLFAAVAVVGGLILARVL